MRIVLLVGTGRCGSTMLSNLLGTHAKVLSVSELFTSLRPDAFPLERLDGDATWRMLTTPRPLATFMADHDLLPDEFLYAANRGRYPSGEVPPIAATALPHLTDDPDALLDDLEPVVRAFPSDHVGRQYERMMSWLAERFHRDVVVERSGASLEYVASMCAAFPDASVVHIHRDPVACALSMREHESFRMARLGARLMQNLGFNPYVEQRAFDVNSVSEELRPLLPDRFDRSAYDAYPWKAEEFGWMWSTLVMAGLPTLKKLPPARLHTLRYEDLLTDPEPTLHSMARFIGLDDSGAWASAAATEVRPPSKNRSDELVPGERQRLARSTSFASRALVRSFPPNPVA